MILGSSRESDSYREVLSALLSSDREQKLLYTLNDNSAIERMLNVLDLVCVIHLRFLPAHTDSRNLSIQRNPA